MKLTIHYESSWRNSFLDGSNNESPPKGGRKFVSSMTELKKSGNYINREITENTVLGILNRLVGDQRKLYQSKLSSDYYFKDLEEKISFTDKPEYPPTSEVVYIRNITGSEDRNSFTGALRSNDPIFTSDYSRELWGVLFLNLPDLLDFMLDSNFIVKADPPLNPLAIIEQLENLNKLKAIEVEGKVSSALSAIQQTFSDVDYKLSAKGDFIPISFYTSALYLQLERLAKKYDLSTALTKSGGLSGISKRGFTKKDFMVKYTTGPKKLVFGNPYMLKEKIKGEGEIVSLLKKATGTLEISIDVPYEKAKQIRTDIENAGVSSFYLGKKGLAWLDEKISLEELH